MRLSLKLARIYSANDVSKILRIIGIGNARFVESGLPRLMCTISSGIDLFSVLWSVMSKKIYNIFG